MGDRPRANAPNRTPRPSGGPPPPTPPATSSTPVSTTTSQDHPSGGTRSGAKTKCFNCGLDGHIARNCPYAKRSKRGEEEARGPRRQEPQPAATTSSTMGALSGEDEDTRTQLEKLGQRLKELEKKFDQEGRTRVLNTVAAEGDSEDSRLGPSVMARVNVNGVPTLALIDTGSPATVVSLEFLLDVFVGQKTEQQTPVDWRVETFKKFSPPTVLQRAYSGHTLDIVAQVGLTLSYGNRTVDATVLVQEGAPHDLLLGTDLQPKLGFAMVVETEGKVTDLLTGGEHLPRTPKTGGRGPRLPATPSDTTPPQSVRGGDEMTVPDSYSVAAGGQGHAEEQLSISPISTSLDQKTNPDQSPLGAQAGGCQTVSGVDEGGSTDSAQSVPDSGGSAGGGELPLEGSQWTSEPYLLDDLVDPLLFPPWSDGDDDTVQRGARSVLPAPSAATADTHQITGKRVSSGRRDGPTTSTVKLNNGETTGVASREGANTPERENVSARREDTNKTPPAEAPLSDKYEPGRIVSLLAVTRIPARHRKLVHAKIQGRDEAPLLLFSPSCSQHDVSMVDAAIEGGDNHCTTLIVTNLGTSPVFLRAGTELGTVAPVEDVELQKLAENPNAVNQDVRLVSQLTADWEGQKEQVLRQLDLSLGHLTDSERTQVRECLAKYADVFALDTSQLGTTTLAEHQIDTGDHPPVRQPPRRLPFALRDQIDRLVKEMLTQDVIVPSASPWASPVVLVRKKDGGGGAVLRRLPQIEWHHQVGRISTPED